MTTENITVEPAAPYGSKENALTALECIVDIAAGDSPEYDPDNIEPFADCVRDYIETATRARKVLLDACKFALDVIDIPGKLRDEIPHTIATLRSAVDYAASEQRRGETTNTKGEAAK